MPRKKREPSFDELLKSIEKMTKRQCQQLKLIFSKSSKASSLA